MQREDAMENYREAERLESILEQKKIPILPALSVYGSKMQEMEGFYFYLFPYYRGTVLKNSEVTEEHCRKIGKILARIHSIDKKNGDGILPKMSIDWKFYLDRLKERNTLLYELLGEHYERILESQERGNCARTKLPDVLAICHNDMDRKNQNLYYIKILMGVINFIILSFLSAVFILTLNKINRDFGARNFLENITYLPNEPVTSTVLIFIAFFLLLGIIEIRRKQRKRQQVSVILYAAEILLCLIIIKFVYVNYNGIILLVIADIVTDIKDKHTRGIFFVIMGMIYLFSDYDIISMFIDMISFQQFLSVYPAKVSMMIQGTRNILVALNAIAFIAYMIILMRNQMKENARIGLLNLQLQTANIRLKEMNEQLKDYSEMTEKMAETRERNRIAREIHDTLGHTMTGLSAGIDACIAMIDFSVDATKEQLNKISQVARQGIKDIRRSVNKLRPDALEHSGLQEALEKMINETMQVSDVKINYDCQVEVLKFNQDEEDMIYRVVQESITNAIRHGKAKQIDVNLWKEDKWLNLEIKDNGIGCEEIHTGFGLIHIEERIKMLKGTVEYDGSNGFKVTARIPIRWGEKL